MTTWFPPGFDAEAHQVRAGVHPDAVLTALADRQHGVAAAAQLRALGVTPAQITDRLASQHLICAQRGLYVVGRRQTDVAARRMAAVLASGAGARLADLSAARQLGARVTEPATVQIVVPNGRRVRRPGLQAREGDVPEHERTFCAGIPCVTMARALLDVAAHQPARAVEALWHEAIYRKLLDGEAVRRVLTDHVGDRGTVPLEALYDRRRHAIGDAANRLEAQLRDLASEAGMPEGQANWSTWIGGVKLKPDLYIPERALAFETDGRDGHEDPEQQQADSARDRLYRSVRITPVRYGWWAVNYKRPGVLADLVRYEAAWRQTQGHWTEAVPQPTFEFARRA